MGANPHKGGKGKFVAIKKGTASMKQKGGVKAAERGKGGIGKAESMKRAQNRVKRMSQQKR